MEYKPFVWDWVNVIKQQRAQIVHGLLSRNVNAIRVHTLILQSLLNLLYGRKEINEEVFNEHYDFSERVLKAISD